MFSIRPLCLDIFYLLDEIYINIFTYIVLGNWETYLYELVMAVYQISFLVYTPGKEKLPQFTFDSQLP